MSGSSPGGESRRRFEERPIVTAPFPELARAARGIGHNLFVLDDDGPIRRVAPFVRSEGGDVPGARGRHVACARRPHARARAGEGGTSSHLGDARLPLLRFPIRRATGETGAVESAEGLIRYRGPALGPDGKPTYRTYGANAILASENLLLNGEKPRVDPAVFKDAIVFVGVTAAGGTTSFMTPLGNTGKHSRARRFTRR